MGRPYTSELENGGKHWALLVAGSTGWNNYRHQSDVCHAYHVISRNGIPDERIVVMMYNDIANNKKNPDPGVIINAPNGPNVFKGVPRDYIGDAVKPTVFLDVLQGNKHAVKNHGSGKVISSGPDDNVFVYFADHGAPGLIAFPYNELLWASKFQEVLVSMYSQQKYAKMLIYIEACHAGSMFTDLPKDINVFAVTASNATQSSYSCYYDPKFSTYLGDCFSVAWMQNSDEVNLKNETVGEQYQIVKKKVTTSEVCKFGDEAFCSMELSSFQGGDKVGNDATPLDPGTLTYPFGYSNSIRSSNVAMHILKKIMEQQNDATARKEYDDLKKEINSIFGIIKEICETVVGSNSSIEPYMEDCVDGINDFEKYQEVVEAFLRACPRYSRSEHILDHFKTFVHLCNGGFSIGDIVDAIIGAVCG